MAIGIQTNIGNRIRAYAGANPGASPTDIARHLGIQTVRVKNALAHPGKRRPKKSVAG